VRRIPITLYPKVTAAGLAIHVVVENPELPILETDAREASASWNRRCGDFDDYADAPLLIGMMRNFIAHAEIESLSLSHDSNLSVWTIAMFKKEINGL